MKKVLNNLTDRVNALKNKKHGKQTDLHLLIKSAMKNRMLCLTRLCIQSILVGGSGRS